MLPESVDEHILDTISDGSNKVTQKIITINK
jgi:hypothetical protein